METFDYEAGKTAAGMCVRQGAMAAMGAGNQAGSNPIGGIGLSDAFTGGPSRLGEGFTRPMTAPEYPPNSIGHRLAVQIKELEADLSRSRKLYGMLQQAGLLGEDIRSMQDLFGRA